MTANWKTLRNTLVWLLIAVMTMGIVIASPHVVKSSAAAQPNTVVVAKASNGSWGAVKNGKIDTSVTGVFKNQFGWWYVKNGLVQFDYTGIQKNQYGWWRIEKGKVNFSATCIYKNEYGWWRVKDGKVDFGANEIYQNPYGWWKTTGGKVTFQETGVFKNAYGWWRVEDSKVNFKFNGLASNKYGLWYIENGKVDFSANGTYLYDGKNYMIKSGKATLITDKMLEAAAVAAEVEKKYGPYSRAVLLYYLKSVDEYTDAEAEYGVDNANIDYNYQALLAASNELDTETVGGMSRAYLVEILGCDLDEGGYAFTRNEVAYAMSVVDQDAAADKNFWNKQALACAQNFVDIMKDLGESYSKAELKSDLIEGMLFTESEANYAVNNVKW